MKIYIQTRLYTVDIHKLLCTEYIYTYVMEMF